MTNSKNTKRALLLSVLSMMLCAAMLIVSTFAWFTDSVTSGVNKIVAGNLDVELYHSNGNVADEEKVEEATKLFTGKDGSSILWEPGVMVYENFTVKNAGTLALKYKLKVNAGNFNTVKDTDLSLKDVLKVAVLDGKFTGGRADAQALTFDKTIADFEKEGSLKPETDGDTYAIVIYWEPSAADNDYNLNNGKTSSDGAPLFIDFGVTLFATQDTVERDSFDTDYDADAWIAVNATDNGNGTFTSEGQLYVKDNNKFVAVTPSLETKGLYTADNGDQYVANAAALTAAIQNGGSVMLMNDTNAGSNSGNRFDIASTITINGNGKKLTTSAPTSLGNRVIDVYEAASATLTITDTVVTGDTTEGEPSYLRYGIGMWDSPNANLNIADSTVEAGHYALAVQSGNDNIAVDIKNSTLRGYSGFQTYSPNTNATFENSHIIGLNQWPVGSNDYAAVCVLSDSGSNAAGTVLTFNNCTIEAVEQNTAKEDLFSLRTGCTLYLNGCTFVKNGVTISTEEIIKDIQNGTNKYIGHYNRSDVSIFVDGIQVK